MVTGILPKRRLKKVMWSTTGSGTCFSFNYVNLLIMKQHTSKTLICYITGVDIYLLFFFLVFLILWCYICLIIPFSFWQHRRLRWWELSSWQYSVHNDSFENLIVVLLKLFPLSLYFQIDVTSFVKNCHEDTCNCNLGGDCECLCTSVAAYAYKCCQEGVSIHWRSPTVCGECPA
jgi:hypothetical protein